MKMYLSKISTAMAIIAVFNIALEKSMWRYIITSVIWCTALQIILDGAVALLVRLTPDHLYGVDNPLFNVSQKERAIHKRLNVRGWKDKIPELGGIGGFSKKTLKDPHDPDYIEKFIIECNRGVVTHRLSYPVGFLAMLAFSDTHYSLTIAFPIAVVNLVLNILPTIVLRYNTPKLRALLLRLERKSFNNNETLHAKKI